MRTILIALPAAYLAMAAPAYGQSAPDVLPTSYSLPPTDATQHRLQELPRVPATSKDLKVSVGDDWSSVSIGCVSATRPKTLDLRNNMASAAKWGETGLAGISITLPSPF